MFCGNQHTWLQLAQLVAGCNLNSVNVERLLRDSSDSCKEIRRLYGHEGNIVFADNKDQKVKTFNPLSATVETLLGTGHEGTVTDLPEKEDEFDTDSESDADNDTDITFSRFGRTTRAHFRLGL